MKGYGFTDYFMNILPAPDKTIVDEDTSKKTSAWSAKVIKKTYENSVKKKTDKS